MSKEPRITLKEMAQQLNRCPKTFRKYVIEYQIPHICLGRDMLFDAVEVENYLSNFTIMNLPTIRGVQDITAKRVKNKTNSKNKSNNRYASLLGLS